MLTDFHKTTFRKCQIKGYVDFLTTECPIAFILLTNLDAFSDLIWRWIYLGVHLPKNRIMSEIWYELPSLLLYRNKFSLVLDFSWSHSYSISSWPGRKWKNWTFNYYSTDLPLETGSSNEVADFCPPDSLRKHLLAVLQIPGTGRGSVWKDEEDSSWPQCVVPSFSSVC